MSIKSRASDAIEKAMRSKNIQVAEEKKGKFDGLVRSLEQEMDNSLEHAFDKLKDRIGELGSEIGVDLHGCRDEAIRSVRENIARG